MLNQESICPDKSQIPLLGVIRKRVPAVISAPTTKGSLGTEKQVSATMDYRNSCGQQGLATTCVMKATCLQSQGQEDKCQMLCATFLPKLDP